MRCFVWETRSVGGDKTVDPVLALQLQQQHSRDPSLTHAPAPKEPFASCRRCSHIRKENFSKRPQQGKESSRKHAAQEEQGSRGGWAPSPRPLRHLPQDWHCWPSQRRVRKSNKFPHPPSRCCSRVPCHVAVHFVFLSLWWLFCNNAENPQPSTF